MTNTKVVPAQLILDAVEQVHSGVSVRPDYSGRYMYGSTCFGLVFEEELTAAFSFFAALGELVGATLDDEDPAYESDLAWSLARAARYDSMGMGTIVYFPDWVVEGNLGHLTEVDEDSIYS